MLEWLIIGGGIHGTYLANLLINQVGVGRDDLRILDPHENLLETWSRNTANCGMHYLRSPATHNLDLPVLSLYRYARSPEGKPERDFIPPYNRPSLRLFQKHCAHVIAANRLALLHIKDRVLALKKNAGDAIKIETGSGELRARNVLLAIGMGEQPNWPAWALRLRQQGVDIQHLFAADFDRNALKDCERTLVIGGGITAVQVALKLAEERSGEIIVLSYHELCERYYDFNPCWIGPKCLADYYQLNYQKRRDVIDRERFPGSTPAEVLDAFMAAREQGNPEFRRGLVAAAAPVDGRIRLETDAGIEEADRILLATGFLAQRPGNPLVEQLISEFDLACNSCGYPIVGRDLRWGEHIFVTGPLAELQVGPCARNIIGARNAGRFLTAAINGPTI